MNRRSSFFVGCGTALNNGGETHDDPPAAVQSMRESVPSDSVHSVTLPHDEPLFPSGPGREEFVTACVVCHSPRYIKMQPRFPRSEWHRLVHKTKNAYGAHISELSGRLHPLSLRRAAEELATMINLIVIAISALMLALVVVWWRWPAFRPWIEAPKYFLLMQESRFDEAASCSLLGTKPRVRRRNP